jgi:hypothetical protein
MEATTSEEYSWSGDAMKKGAVLGIIHIFIFLVIYYTMPSKLTGFSYLLIILLINLGFTAYNTIQYRNEIGGFINFGSAFKYGFVLLVTNGLINIFFAALFIMIEPAYPNIMAQAQLDTSIYWAQKMGAPENTLEKMRDDFNFEEIEGRFSFSGLLVTFGIGILLYALGACITALIARKREPETF